MIRDSEGNQRFYGLYRAVVFDNSDPDNLKRIKVRIPQVLGSQVTGWAWPKTPSGLVLAVPPVGQGVWIEFEGGDPSFPVWTGTFGTSVDSNYYVDIEPLSSGTLINNALVTNTGIDGSKTINLVKSIYNLSTTIDGGSA